MLNHSEAVQAGDFGIVCLRGVKGPGCETTGGVCMSGVGSVATTRGNIQHTADLLDVSRPTVYRRIDKYKIDTENLAQYTQS